MSLKLFFLSSEWQKWDSINLGLNLSNRYLTQYLLHLSIMFIIKWVQDARHDLEDYRLSTVLMSLLACGHCLKGALALF